MNNSYIFDSLQDDDTLKYIESNLFSNILKYEQNILFEVKNKISEMNKKTSIYDDIDYFVEITSIYLDWAVQESIIDLFQLNLDYNINHNLSSYLPINEKYNICQDFIWLIESKFGSDIQNIINLYK